MAERLFHFLAEHFLLEKAFTPGTFLIRFWLMLHPSAYP